MLQDAEEQRPVSARWFIRREPILQVNARRALFAVHEQDHAAVARSANQLDRAPEHVLADSPDQRGIDLRRRRRLGLPRGVLGTDLLALAREQGRQPLRIEDVHQRIDEDPALERADQLAGAAHRQLAGPGHMDDRVIGPVGNDTATAPAGRQPRRPGMSQAPDPQSLLDRVRGNQRRLEGCGRTETPQLVRRERTAAIESKAQGPFDGAPASGRRSGGVSSRRKRVGLASSDVNEAWNAAESASHSRSRPMDSSWPGGQCSTTYRAKSGGYACPLPMHPSMARRGAILPSTRPPSISLEPGVEPGLQTAGQRPDRPNASIHQQAGDACSGRLAGAVAIKDDLALAGQLGHDGVHH